MINISHLRTLVKKGYTIANRKILKQQIGASDYTDMCSMLKKIKNKDFFENIPDYKDTSVIAGLYPSKWFKDQVAAAVGGVSSLRMMITNGWTIKNRKQLEQLIGKKQYKDLEYLVKDSDRAVMEDFQSVFYKLKSEPQAINDYRQIFARTYFNKPWSRAVTLGKGNWNAEHYGTFKKSYRGAPRIHLDETTTTEARKLFDSLKPLGCDEIHYRGEVYCREGLEHFENINKLKIGDIYKPHSNFWFSNSKDYAWGSYGHARSSTAAERKFYGDEKAVQYEILCPADAKIIQTPYAHITNSLGERIFFTEGIYDDRAAFKIIDKIYDGKTLKLRCEYLT